MVQMMLKILLSLSLSKELLIKKHRFSMNCSNRWSVTGALSKPIEAFGFQNG